MHSSDDKCRVSSIQSTKRLGETVLVDALGRCQPPTVSTWDPREDLTDQNTDLIICPRKQMTLRYLRTLSETLMVLTAPSGLSVERAHGRFVNGRLTSSNYLARCMHSSDGKYRVSTIKSTYNLIIYDARLFIFEPFMVSWVRFSVKKSCSFQLPPFWVSICMYVSMCGLEN